MRVKPKAEGSCACKCPVMTAKFQRISCLQLEYEFAQAPIYPTFREAGGAENLDVDLWYAVLAPARTPREVVLRLQQEIGAVLALPEVRATLIKQGLTPAPGNSDELAALIKADLARWQKLVTAAKISAD